MTLFRSRLPYLSALLALSLTACGPAPGVQPAAAPTPGPSPTASTEPAPSATPAEAPASGSPGPSPTASQRPDSGLGVPADAEPLDPVKRIRTLNLDTTQRFMSGAGEQLQLMLDARDAEGQNVVTALDWTSSRPQDVRVEAQGLLTSLVDEGFSEIRVRVPGTELSASILISVTSPSSGGGSGGSSGRSRDDEPKPFVPFESDELKVDQTRASDESEPAVALDDSGNALVVWSSNDGGRLDVMARYYRSNGKPLGDEFRVNAFTREDQYEPDVAALGDGKFVVVWTSETQDGSNQGIIGQRIDARGRRLGEAFVVNDVTSGNQSRASVASDADGDYIVAWEDSYGRDGDGSGIYARRFAKGGSRGGEAILVNDVTAGNQAFPNLDLDDDGDFTVVYALSNGAIAARSFKADLSPIALGFQVNQSFDLGNTQARVDLDEDGDYAVVWKQLFYDQATNEGDIFVRRFKRDGEPIGDEQRHGTILDDISPDVAIDADGSALLTWWVTDFTSVLHTQLLDSEGGPDGPEFSLTSQANSYNQPRLAGNRKGQYTAAWFGESPDDTYSIGLKYFLRDD